MNTITATRTGANRMGRQTWRISKKDVPKLMEWSDFDLSKVRGSRGIRKDGTLHFATGAGYAIFDSDLLGGTGDGTAERAFNEATGYTVRMK